ncbi:unnamed protein product [Mycena citricolor]|uniref:Copper transport protein n=1 Tax=Mycena citricolor TaxID=2018698 RepID=A0AAD2H1S0_9AGAR|nr:unnamed protein product [Mycena citricolor]
MDMMNMTSSAPSTNATSSAMPDHSMPDMSLMMKAYLHFTPGDLVLFKSIAPRSGGEIFAACLIFFLLAVGERYLRALHAEFRTRCVARTRRLMARMSAEDGKPLTADAADTHAIPPVPRRAPRTPFILTQELARGALAGVQSTFHYALMLVAMTFNVAYIASIVIGTVVGEMAFGRLGH